MTDRAVSVTVNYVMTITIATLMLSGLVVSAGGLIESQSERAIESELEVLGHQLAADIESTDRLTMIDDKDTNVRKVETETRLPTQVAGTGYSLDIDAGEITLRTTDPAVSVTIQFEASTTVSSPRTVQGGDVLIHWSDETGRVVVESA